MWVWFCQIFNANGNGWGPSVIPYGEIEAYSRLHGIRIRPWETQLIRDLSAEYVAIASRKPEADGTAGPKVPGLKNVTEMTDTQGLRGLFPGARVVKRKKAN